jgi:hypothetical protein
MHKIIVRVIRHNEKVANIMMQEDRSRHGSSATRTQGQLARACSRGYGPSRRDGLDGECARPAIIVVP